MPVAAAASLTGPAEIDCDDGRDVQADLTNGMNALLRSVMTANTARGNKDAAAQSSASA